MATAYEDAFVSIPRRSPLPFTGVSKRKRALFYTQLARMLHAGIGVLRALRTLGKQRLSRRLSRAAREMAAQIESGATLAEAFASHPNLFPENEVRMIEASEHGGASPDVMLRIARFLERLVTFWLKVMTGMIYPLLLLLAAFVFVPLLFAFFMGGFERMLATQAMALGIGAAGVLVGLTAWRAFSSVSTPRAVIHGILLQLPVFGKLARRLALARFADTFECLYSAGVRSPEAMARAAMACGNAVIARRILGVVPMVREGLPISVALGHSGAVSLMGLNMIQVGEEVGKLDEALSKFAEYQQLDAETTIERLAKILPFLVYLCVIVVMVFMILQGAARYGQMIEQQIR